MKITFYQILHSLKRVFTDTKPLLSKFATIAVVILILGSAFQTEFSSQSLDPVRLGIYNEDAGDMGAFLINSLKESEDTDQWIELIDVDSFQEGENRVSNSNLTEEEKLDGLIFIEKDFSDKVNSNTDSSIIIYSGKASQVQAIIIKCVFNTFVSAVNLNKIVAEEFGTGVSSEYSMEAGVKELEMESVQKPGAMDYYAIAMLLMFLIFSAEYGCDSIAENYSGVIGDRLKTTPLSPLQQYLGKIAGLCIASTLQGVFLILFTKVCYDVNWGSNYLMLLFIVFTMSCTAIAIGALVCMIARDKSRGQAIVMLIVIACTFLAGGFAKINLGSVKYLSPNYYAHVAITTTVYGGDMKTVYLYIGILWGITVVAAILTILFSRRKRA
jgi:ABC-2 type transport system permease protein